VPPSECDPEIETVVLAGTGAYIRELCSSIRLVAPTEAMVLISGGTGTGKNTIAALIHLFHESRWPYRFRRTNLGALVPELAASQLFGHVPGAFTGAVRKHEGIVREAHGGTLFLDQLADAPANVQDMLLTLTEVRKINPVGAPANHTPFEVDVRVVSATIETPEELLANQKLRSDLLYRIMEYQITLPALRDKPDEIEALSHYFLDEGQPLRELRPGPDVIEMSPITAFTDEAMQKLRAHCWPGNTRELRHVIRSALIYSRAAPDAEKLGAKWLRLLEPPPGGSEYARAAMANYQEALCRFNHLYAHHALALTSGRSGEAATLMGVSNDTFRKYRDWKPEHLRGRAKTESDPPASISLQND